MKVDDYTPYISAIVVQLNIGNVEDQKLLRIEDLFSLPPGNYLLSLNNPRCSVDKSITKQAGYGFYSKKDTLIKYYLTDAIIAVPTDSVESIVSRIIHSANFVKSKLIENAPAFQKYFVDDIDLCLKELLIANGLKHLLPIP